jgi:hypothetical protein
VILKKPKLLSIIYPLSIGTICTIFIEITQFLNQAYLGGWVYYLGERSFDLQTPNIAHLVVDGRLYLRPYSFFSHPNVLAGFLLLLWPVWFFWKINLNSKWQYLLRQILIVFSLLGIFLTFSRIAWLGTVLMLIFIPKKKFRLMKVFLLIFILFILEEIFLGRFVNFYLDTQPINERNLLITNAFDMFRKSPMMGIGLGNFLPQLPTVQKPPYLLQPVHNFWFLILTETGLTGLLLAIIFFINTVKRSIINKKYYLFVSIALFFWLSWFDHYFYDIKQTQWILGILISLIWV